MNPGTNAPKQKEGGRSYRTDTCERGGQSRPRSPLAFRCRWRGELSYAACLKLGFFMKATEPLEYRVESGYQHRWRCTLEFDKRYVGLGT